MPDATEILLGKAAAGELTPVEAEALAAALAANPPLADDYAKDARFGALLHAALAGPAARERFERGAAGRLRAARGGSALLRAVRARTARLAVRDRWARRFAVAVTMAASAAVVLVTLLALLSARPPAPDARPVVDRVAGPGEAGGAALAAGARLDPGASIRTGAGGALVLRFPDGTTLELGGDTTFALEGVLPVKRVALARGVLGADVAPQPAGRPLVLRTPQAQADVLGTRLTLAVRGEATRLDVEEGRVRLTRLSDRRSVEVSAGHGAVAAPGRALEAVPRDAPAPAPDAVPAAVPPTPAGAPATPLRWQPLDEPGCGGWITSIRVSPHDSRRILLGGDVLGIGLSEDRGETWQGTSGLRVWEIGDLTWHPTDPLVAWAGTMGGPYASRDGGRTWALKRTGMPAINDWMFSAPIEKVLFDPADPRRLLAVGGSSRRMTSPGTPRWGAVWESRDAGESWSLLATLTADGASRDPKAKGINIVGATFAAGSSDRLYAAVDGHGLYASEDGGRTWAKRNAGLPHTAIERVIAHPRERDTLWILLTACKPAGEPLHLPGGVFKSVDAGRTWTACTKGLPAVRHADFNFSSTFKGFAACESAPDTLIAGECAWSGGAVYRSTDGGASWSAVVTRQKADADNPATRDLAGAFRPETAYFAGLGMTVLEIDPRDPKAFLGGGSEYILRSLDGGATWTDASAARVDGASGAWRGRGYSGLCSVGFRFDPFRKGRALVLAMDAGKCWESLDGLTTWTYRGHDPWPWGGGSDAAFARDGTTYATTGQFGSFGGLLRTTGGKAWTSLAGKDRGLPEYRGNAVATGVHTLPDDPRQVWAVIGGTLYRSADGGERWSALQSGGLQWIAADPRKPSRFYVSGPKGVLATEDGASFRPIGGPKPAYRMDCDRDGRLYVTGYRIDRGAGLWCHADGTWTRLLDEYYASNVAADPSNPARLLLATNDDPFHDVCKAAGPWLSADGGKSWAAVTDGLSMLRGHAVAFDPFDPERIVYGTLGRGYFVARWPAGHPLKAARTYTHTAEDAALAAAEAPAPAPPPKRLPALVNGSMTEGADVPTGWEGKWGDVQVARDAAVFKSAPASLRVRGAAGKSGQAFQLLDAAGGQRLRVRGVATCAGRAKVNAALQAFDEGWTRNEFVQLLYLQDDADWTAFDRTVALPVWAARFNVQLLVEGDGTAWMDDVTVDAAP
jgi:ferric-dicitrate binding protein FerR (iron transport regulator)